MKVFIYLFDAHWGEPWPGTIRVLTEDCSLTDIDLSQIKKGILIARIPNQEAFGKLVSHPEVENVFYDSLVKSAEIH